MGDGVGPLNEALESVTTEPVGALSHTPTDPSQFLMTWGSPRARVYVKCVGTVRAASHPPVWIHRKCELRSLKKMLNSLRWDDDYTIAQWLEHR